MSRNKLDTKDSYLYDVLFFVIVLFVYSCHIALFSVISDSSFLDVPIYQPDWEIPRMILFDGDGHHLFWHPIDVLKTFRIANVIFTCLNFLFRDAVLAFNITPTVMLLLSMFFIYRIVGLLNNKLWGVIAAVFFACFPITIVYSKFNICHWQETVYLLSAFFFYLLFNQRKRNIYWWCYAFSVINIFFQRGSGVLYVFILMVLDFYFAIKDKEKRLISLRRILGMTVFICLIIFFDREYFERYVYGHMKFGLHSEPFTLIQFFKLYVQRGVTFFSASFLFLLICSFFVFLSKNKLSKVKKKFLLICDINIGVVLLFFFIVNVFNSAVRMPRLEDIFPLFSFFAIRVGVVASGDYFRNNRVRWLMNRIFICIISIFIVRGTMILYPRIDLSTGGVLYGDLIKISAKDVSRLKENESFQRFLLGRIKSKKVKLNAKWMVTLRVYSDISEMNKSFLNKEFFEMYGLWEQTNYQICVNSADKKIDASYLVGHLQSAEWGRPFEYISTENAGFNSFQKMLSRNFFCFYAYLEDEAILNKVMHCVRTNISSETVDIFHAVFTYQDQEIVVFFVGR